MESTKPYSEFPTYVKLMAETLDLWSTNEFNPLMAASVFFFFKRVFSLMRKVRNG